MTEIVLVRHGQANSQATDEAGYDRLSPLGVQQAHWLGAHLAPLGQHDRIVSGSLRRQQDTARAANPGGLPHDTDPRLNELDYFGLSQSLQSSHGIPFPDSAAAFAAHVPMLIDVWKAGRMDPGVETYDSFRTRIHDALRDAAESGGRCLLVTSTGVIATLIAIALGLDTAAKTKMFLTIPHTSIHKVEWRAGDIYLTQYGATPHLDSPDRAHARTFI